MIAFHQRLAEVALRAAESHGFVLAGGYAISANGMGNRPSMDVDLFTNQFDIDGFAEALEAVRAAFEDDGLKVEDNQVAALFADLRVSDPGTGEASDIQLGANYREFPPARIELGPVLDQRDAVASKMSALWSRGEVRDFIDISTVLDSGRFSRDEILRIADQQEATPMDRGMLSMRFREISHWPVGRFASYGVDSARRDRILSEFLNWADQIDPDRPTAGEQREQ